jgi:hypothetical protein
MYFNGALIQWGSGNRQAVAGGAVTEGSGASFYYKYYLLDPALQIVLFLLIRISYFSVIVVISVSNCALAPSSSSSLYLYYLLSSISII